MLLRPSKSYQWSNCAASASFQEHLPEEPPSDEAREGTCAAWVADCVLKGDAHSAEDLTGETHANGWLVTPDMVEHVQKYIDMIQARGGVTTSEQFVKLTDNIQGTLDNSASLESLMRLHVDDLKYGYQIVEIYENPQLIIYGAAEVYRLNNPAIREVELGIYQPRAFHPEGIYRTWKMSVIELMEHARRIIEAGDRALAPNPIATPGPWCKNCRAASSCIALTHSVYADHSYVQDSRQKFMTSEELVKELNALDDMETRLKARKTAVFAEAEQRMKNNEFLPGWYMKPRWGNRVLTVDPKVVTWLTGVEATEVKPKTPAQLEREGVPLEIMSKLSRAPEIGSKLDRLPKNYFAKAFK